MKYFSLLQPPVSVLVRGCQRPPPVELVLLGPVDARIGLFRVVDAQLDSRVELVFTDRVKIVECRRVD